MKTNLTQNAINITLNRSFETPMDCITGLAEQFGYQLEGIKFDNQLKRVNTFDKWGDFTFQFDPEYVFEGPLDLLTKMGEYIGASFVVTKTMTGNNPYAKPGGTGYEDLPSNIASIQSGDPDKHELILRDKDVKTILSVLSSAGVDDDLSPVKGKFCIGKTVDDNMIRLMFATILEGINNVKYNQESRISMDLLTDEIRNIRKGEAMDISRGWLLGQFANKIDNIKEKVDPTDAICEEIRECGIHIYNICELLGVSFIDHDGTEMTMDKLISYIKQAYHEDGVLLDIDIFRDQAPQDILSAVHEFNSDMSARLGYLNIFKCNKRYDESRIQKMSAYQLSLTYDDNGNVRADKPSIIGGREYFTEHTNKASVALKRLCRVHRKYFGSVATSPIMVENLRKLANKEDLLEFIRTEIRLILGDVISTGGYPQFDSTQHTINDIEEMSTGVKMVDDTPYFIGHVDTYPEALDRLHAAYIKYIGAVMGISEMAMMMTLSSYLAEVNSDMKDADLIGKELTTVLNDAAILAPRSDFRKFATYYPE